MRCEARSRAERGTPWIQCQREATVLLMHKGASKRYCNECASRFEEAFPRGTFTRAKLGPLDELHYISRRKEVKQNGST